MSGYLGRMLWATARGEHQLHPFAGSIYGDRSTAAEQSNLPNLGEARQTGEDQELLEIERTVLSRVPSARAAKPQAEYPPPFLEEYEPLQPRRREAEAHRPGAAALSGPARADLDAQGEQTTGREIQKRSARSDTSLKFNVSSEAVSDPAQSHAEETRSKAGAMHIDGERSATATKGREATQTHGELIARERAQTMATTRQPAQPRQQSSPPRESARTMRAEEPEVQVHIGRIEVLAVQPPAPAAPAPRRERTTSLADYLAKRNGRGR
jgi:hypothetical protein